MTTAMKNYFLLLLIGFIFLFGCTAKTSSDASSKQVQTEKAGKSEANSDNLKLGAFSISLSVKDLKVSREFYENLGFHVKGGSMEQNYLVMKNGNSLIGLFQGMFEGNMLTFNPGWDESGEETNPFDDVRAIEKQLKEKNTKLMTETEAGSTGPAYIMFTDPDGNVILIDQHR